MRNFSKFIASGFGVGFLPKAPGTWGALLAFLISLPFLEVESIQINTVLVILVMVFTVLGIWSSNQVESEWGHDPKQVVVDEMVGFWISIIFVPAVLKYYIIGFVLFRFFDILKPLGIRKAEQLKGGYGVMGDDILAGIYSNIVLQCVVFIMK